MTEREAVAALKKLARQSDCALREEKESLVRYGHQFQNGFVIGWSEESKKEKETVSFFAFSNSPVDPPAEILQAFRNVRKAHIRPAERDLTWLEHLKGLRCLEIYDWNGQRLPAQWKDSETTLEKFYLVTQTGKIPVQLRRFQELRSLGLDSKETLELPGWLAQLTKLERLLLRECVIRDIPASLTHMGLPFVVSDSDRRQGRSSSESAWGRGIFLDGSKLVNGNINLFRRGPKEIEEYYQKREKRDDLRKHGMEMESTPECMVVFLGDGAAGKTSLIDRIMKPNYSFAQGASMPTNGIKMERWPPVKDDGNPLRELLGNRPLVLRLRDFGGQEIMYSLHRCFMSKHTVYVVVCESRMDADIDINAARWIETVKEFAPNSPVILALNKADLNPNVSVNIKDLQRRNPALKYVLKTSANPESKYDIKDLLRKIIDEALPLTNSFQAGKDWLAVKQELEDMTQDYITSQQYREICERHDIHNEDDQREMLDWFRDLGIVYSYSDSDSSKLDNTLHVLNPEWLSNGAYRVILRAPEGGFPTVGAIRKTLATPYPGDISKDVYKFRPDTGADEPEFILHVMRKFEISKRLNEEQELIPTRLVKTPPEEADDFDKTDALHLRWAGSYLPNNLAHRLIIDRFDDLGKEPCVWRTGGWFYQDPQKPEGNQALVEMNERHLDLYVTNQSGEDCRPYLTDMRQSIRDILWDLNLLGAEEQLFWENGSISYNSLMAQNYMSHNRDVFIPGAAKYVKPDRVLRAFYSNADDMVREYRQQQEYRHGNERTQPHSEASASDTQGHKALPNLHGLGGEIWDTLMAYPWLFGLLGSGVAGLIGVLTLI